MSVHLLTQQNLKFLSLKGGCTGSSESIHVKLPHCWKSHVAAHYVSLFKLCTVLYLLHKHMPNSNTCIKLCTKSRIKTKKLANQKTKRKKNQMLLDSNPHLLSAKTLDYPLGYRGIEINFIQISNCTTI